MVNFVCGGCGATLKKKLIAQHTTTCSNCSISCMDCGKVFEKEEYEAHNVCVTEAEKYGPKKKKNEETPVKDTPVKATPVKATPVKAKEAKPKTEVVPSTRPFNTFKNVMINSLHVTDEELLQKIWKLMQENGAKVGKPKHNKHKKRKISTSQDGGDGDDSATPKKRGKIVQTAQNGNKGKSPGKKARAQKKKKLVK